uniref:Uncharacterized protein n=1 Tax=Arundo donax TaxID=35708 RepID=A0A0A9H1R1_ARUDO
MKESRKILPSTTPHLQHSKGPGKGQSRQVLLQELENILLTG